MSWGGSQRPWERPSPALMEVARNHRIRPRSPDLSEQASVVAQKPSYSGKASYGSTPTFERALGSSHDVSTTAEPRHPTMAR